MGAFCEGIEVLKHRQKAPVLHPDISKLFELSAACSALLIGISYLIMRTLPAKGIHLERRSAVRYKLQLPVIFHWDDGVKHTGGGFTCNVALDGALIRSATSPPIGSEIRVEVLIPSSESAVEELRIQCVGRVTRVTDASTFATFGVEGCFDDDHITYRALH